MRPRPVNHWGGNYVKEEIIAINGLQSAGSHS